MNRLMLRITLGLTLVLLFGFILFSSLMHMRMMQAVEEATVPNVKLIGQLLSIPLQHVPPSAYDQMAHRLKRDLDIPVKILPLDDPSIPNSLRPRLEKNLLATQVETDFQNRFFVPSPHSNQVLAVGPSPPFKPIPWPEFIVALGLLFLVVIIAGWALTRPLTKKLRILEEAAARIASGHLDARAEVEGSDPIGAFTARFNQMAERNQQMLEKRRELLQAVSHELRTPTARIRFSMEMMQNAKDDAEREARLTSIDDDLQELDDLVEELLLFNKLESLKENEAHKPVPVGPVLEQIRDQIRHTRPEVEIQLEGESAQDLCVQASPKLFARAMRNLLANALRHAKTRVVVTLAGEEDRVRVEVRDDGAGVPQSKRSSILEPFSRLDESRSRDSGGAGLGLAIVQRIVQNHKAELEITDAPEGGANFITRWPR